MKHQVYKIAAMAFISLWILSIKTYAQDTPAAPAPPAAPVVAGMPGESLAALTKIAPLALQMAETNFKYMGQTQDTVYRKKMQKLQEQMHDLQKQMSALRTEEWKKNSVDMSRQFAETGRVMAEKSRVFAKDFDKRFNARFKNFGQNMHFNFEKSDADLDKKVQSGEYKLKTKTYTKSYPVNRDDKLQISNRYGKVTVNTWAKNEVKVDVEIKTYANDDDAAQKLLDGVKITDSKDNNGVSFTTVMDEDGHKTFWGVMNNNGKSTVHKAIVNYTVYMPAKNPLTISNTFGAIVLPDLSGKINIKNSYGSLTTKALTNTGNVINIAWGAANIESLTGSDLNVSYGSLNLQSADKLNADIRYSPAKIGKLSTSGTINLRYGDGLQIVNLDKNLKNLSVNSSFAPIKLSSLNNDNADFDVTVRNGDFSYDNGINVTSKTPEDEKSWSTTKTYKGHIGKGNSDKLIVIKSNYSNVKFDQQ